MKFKLKLFEELLQLFFILSWPIFTCLFSLCCFECVLYFLKFFCLYLSFCLYFLFSGDSTGFSSPGGNSMDVSLFSDMERLSQEFRHFQSNIGQNVRDLTTFKSTSIDEMERLSESVNELQELVSIQ